MASQYLASSSIPSPTMASLTTTTSAHDYDGASFKTPVTRSIMKEPLGGGCRARSMGNVQLRNRDTHEIILRPTPTSDPNDPLNWPQWFKYYLTGLTCVAIMMCNFLAAGPTIAIVETSLEFLPNLPISDAIAKVAFFFTTTALLQGIGNFIWIPLTNKFGRRPVYMTSYLIYLASTVWLVYERSYTGFLAGRILMGFGSGAADTIAPLTITDLFFLHERGAVMCAYTAFLSMGVGLGLLVSGFIVRDHDWRAIYQVSAVIIAIVMFLIIATFPETTYRRPVKEQEPDLIGADTTAIMLETKRTTETEASVEQPRTKESFWRMMRLFKGVQTEESMTKMFFRPLGLILLPPVLWAALVQAVTIGFLVAVTSNVAPAFESAYGFEPYQIGLCFAATLVGSLLGIPAGGHLGDMVADIFTRRNGGIREPEMRLPAIAVSVVTTPLALVLFGVGIGDQLHWICPTIGLALLNFSITQAGNICLVYVIDAYRPVSGEITLAVLGFKAVFGFLLSFYTNPWVAQVGYKAAYGQMAGIAAAVLLMSFPLYVWGKRVRTSTLEWRMFASVIRWTDDREVGE